MNTENEFRLVAESHEKESAHRVREEWADLHRRRLTDSQPDAFGHGILRGIRASPDQGAAAGMHSACQKAGSISRPK